MSAHEPVFGAPWEAQAFAMVVALQERGVFDAGEWAETLGATIAAAGPDAAYYDCWLAALETIVDAKSVASTDTVARYRAAWSHAAARTPHGSPIELTPADF